VITICLVEFHAASQKTISEAAVEGSNLTEWLVNNLAVCLSLRTISMVTSGADSGRVTQGGSWERIGRSKRSNSNTRKWCVLAGGVGEKGRIGL